MLSTEVLKSSPFAFTSITESPSIIDIPTPGTKLGTSEVKRVLCYTLERFQKILTYISDTL
jgi:hypothetical protein